MDREQIERISKALGDSTRLRIFEAISSKSHMACQDLVAMRGVTPATVSHHMKILSDANLIRCRREGQFVFSEAIPETIDAYSKALAKIATARSNGTSARTSAKSRATAAKR
jgi:ArsR family transcriptional regulator